MGYFYLYDSFLQERSYAGQLVRLEATLTDLGLQGRIGRLTLLKSVRDLVEGAIREGADTVVAVGNDATLSQVVQATARHPKVTVGFLPFGDSQQELADLLGIPRGLTACHVLSGRIVEPITLGKINSQYFLKSVTANGPLEITCDGSFRLTFEGVHELKVANLDWWGAGYAHWPAGTVAVMLRPAASRRSWMLGSGSSGPASVLPAGAVEVCSLAEEELPLTIDGYRTAKTPAVVSATNQKVRLIVGKKRLLPEDRVGGVENGAVPRK